MMRLLKYQTILNKKYVYLLLYLIPIAILLWFIANFGINNPFWDQMEFAFIFKAISGEKPNFEPLFEQHNEL